MLMRKAYAKINLGLKVVGKDLSDGYHYLDMINLPIELHDRIEVEILEDWNFGNIITCDDKSLPTDETNIVYKILKVMNEKYHFNKKLRIHIHKTIPLCAGLGGGSADAAAVMLAVNDLLKLKASIDDLCALGLKVGYDIPFCLRNQAARVSLKGEKVEKIKVKKNLKLLICKPSTGLETGPVYHQYDLEAKSSNVNLDNLVIGLANNDLEMIKNNIGNDLEYPAMSLDANVAQLKEDMLHEGFEIVSMTGSGSCMFALSNDDRKIEKAARNLEKKGYTTFITHTI
jgi:4-diphosphocytidyl-2-C-methyl-D-erythritol kinase